MNTTLRQQHTIGRPVEVSGFGYWSGQDVRVEFRPAEPDRGIVFVRGDLAEPVHIPALVAHRVEVPRRTTLRHGGASVEMVEHIMAALWGLDVDNCEVWVDAAEMPGCDGSSLPFVEALDAAGIVAQDAARAQLVIHEPSRLGDDDHWVQAAAHEARPGEDGAPGAGLRVRFRLDYGSGPIGRETLELDITPALFKSELAASRTFLLKEEADWLQAQGLGTRATPQDLLVFGEAGVIDNELRFADECVRHKTLDLVGDLALAGCDIAGCVTAHRSGHRLNAELVKVLLAEGQLVTARDEPGRRTHRRSA